MPGRSATPATKTLILRWNGKTWKQVPSPSPGTGAGLYGVAATSGRSAWAVGYTGTSTGTKTLILRWNGTAWKQVPSPSPAGDGAFLYGVAATSARSAWAAGCSGCAFGGFAQSLIVRWNGTAWKQVPSPSPAGGGDLFSVATVSASSAWAVGDITPQWLQLLGEDPDRGLERHRMEARAQPEPRNRSRPPRRGRRLRQQRLGGRLH